MARSDAKHRLGPYRDPNIDTAVFEATRRLLGERGYRGTSIDGIAEAAGVARPTIYRRWPSKAHLVYDAVYPDDAEQVQTTSRNPIKVIAGAMRGVLGHMALAPAREALPSLMSDMRTDEELRGKLQERHSSTVAAGLSELLSRNPEIFRDVDADVVLDIIAGAAIHALCIRDVDDLDSYAEKLCDVLFYGLISRPGDS